MNYAFGAAQELYAEHRHPRMLFGPEDVDRLREISGTGDGAKIASALWQRAQAAAEDVLAYESDEALVGETTTRDSTGRALVARGRTTRMADMALCSLIAEDTAERERMLSAVRRLLRTIPMADRNIEGRTSLGYSGLRVLGPAYDMIQAQLPEEERAAFCTWALRRAIEPTLEKLLPTYYLHPAMNIPMTGLLNVVQGLLAIDGEASVGDLSDYWDQALPMFEASAWTCVGPEGYPTEDTGYGTLMFSRLAQTAEMLRRAGIWDVYERCRRYQRFGQAVLHIVQPWGDYLTTTGDHGDDFGQRTFPLARLAEETNDPALLWLLLTLSDSSDIDLGDGRRTDGTIYALLAAPQLSQAKPPSETQPPTAFCDRGRGFVTFRTDWGREATYLAFDGSVRSPAGQGHEHASCGHFMLSALGDWFAIGPGRYNMEQNCHNVVLVDGKSGRSTQGQWERVKHPGRLIGYWPGEFVDAAAVDSSHQHNCYWARRHIGLVKGEGAHGYVWIVEDINKWDDWAEYWWQLHVSPEDQIEPHGDWATITGWRSGSKLDVHFGLPAPHVYPRPHELLGLAVDEVEPSSYEYVKNPAERVKKFDRPAEQIHYSTFQRPRLVARIAGYNGRFISVLLPRRPEESPAEVERIESMPASLAMRVSFESVEDIIIFAHEHHLLRAADIEARGTWCVVRRERASGKVLAYQLGEGTELTVADRRVL